MKSNERWGNSPFEIETDGAAPRTIVVSGRVRWALEMLMAAGERGCTPIDTPGPRWSDYVFKLRGEGVDIESIHERHTGPFAGTHARYVLRCRVSHAGSSEAAA